MGTMRTRHHRAILVAGALGLATLGVGACPGDDLPACPGQCFAYTVELEQPLPCQDAAGQEYFIAFTGTNPSGYRGRFCFNASSVALVVDAIDHVHGGGRLSDLGADVQSAYISTVNAVQADLQAECVTAAAGQCTNANQVCTGIAADMYEQLVVDETCVLELDGTQPVMLGPGQQCESLGIDPTAGSEDSGEHCIETSTVGNVPDDTAGSSGADDTGEGTTGMAMSTELRVVLEPPIGHRRGAP